MDAGEAGTPGTVTTRRKAAVCALLFGATLLNYLDRQALAVMAPLVRAEMGLDLAQVGWLFSAFYWCYAAGQIGVGFALDRVKVKVAYAVAVALWSAAGAATGLAAGLTSLLLLRALLGLCEAANWPAALRVVAEVFPRRERALANGVFQSGSSVGALVAPPVLVLLAGALGWRAGFAIVGALGALWVVAWAIGFRPVAGAGARAPSPDGEAPSTVAEILRSRAFLGLFVASFFLNPILYFYVNWLPSYFVESGQPFGQALAGQLFVVYLALDAGYLTGGLAAAWLARRLDVPRARRVVASAGVPLMVALVIVPRAGGLAAVLAVISCAAVGLGWFMSNYLASVQDVSPARVSTVAGLLGAAGSIGGAIFMALVGGIAHRSGSFAWPFLMLAAMPLVALGGLWVGTTPGRRAPALAPRLAGVA